MHWRGRTGSSLTTSSVIRPMRSGALAQTLPRCASCLCLQQSALVLLGEGVRKDHLSLPLSCFVADALPKLVYVGCSSCHIVILHDDIVMPCFITQHQDLCAGYISSKGGAVPVGLQDWLIHPIGPRATAAALRMRLLVLTTLPLPPCPLCIRC